MHGGVVKLVRPQRGRPHPHQPPHEKVPDVVVGWVPLPDPPEIRPVAAWASPAEKIAEAMIGDMISDDTRG